MFSAPRSPRLRGIVAAVAVAAATLAVSVGQAGLAPSAAHADDQGLHFTGGTQRPIQVERTADDPQDDYPEPVYVDFTSDTAAHDVKVTASGDGLSTDVYLYSDYKNLDAGESADAEVFVSAADAGFHTLTVTVSSSDAGSDTETFPLIWAAGEYSVPSNGSLAGRTFVYQGFYGDYSDCEGCTALEQHRVTFVDPTHAVVGGLDSDRSTCGECRTYHYDTSTGLVQIGDGLENSVIGELSDQGLYTDGLVEAVPEDTDDYYESATLTEVHPLSGNHLNDTWTFHDRSSNYPLHGFTSVALKLTASRHYDLRYRVYGKNGGLVHRTGTYRINTGKLLLSYRANKRFHTLTVPTQKLDGGDLLLRLPEHLKGKGHQHLGGIIVHR